MQEFEAENLPLDRVVDRYFKKHKSLGSKDRGFIANACYDMVRWRGLLDALGARNWQERLSLLDKVHSKHPELPLHVQASCPKVLWQYFVRQYGEEKAFEIALQSNTQAPLTIRCNPLKISREELLSHFTNAVACTSSPFGICLKQRESLLGMQEFKEGFFELQDEASQMVALQVEAKPHDCVLDYCAGAGGKSLAFAHRLLGKGSIHLHDVRPWALAEAKRRFRRAGITNVRFDLPKKADWILLDVPCSGTGTLRRNPDMKWRFSESGLQELVSLQRRIIDEAMAFARPGTHVVYATCSLLKEENEDQVDYLTSRYGLKPVAHFSSLPTSGGMDGLWSTTSQVTKPVN